MTLKKFARVRIIRLYPLIALGAVWGTCFLLMRFLNDHPNLTFLNIAGSGAFAMFAVPVSMIEITPSVFPVNLPLWSIFVEVCANIAYALVARFLTRSWLVALTLVGATLVAAAILGYGHLDLGPTRDNLLGGLARIGFAFTAGLLLYEFRPQRAINPMWGLAFTIALTALYFAPGDPGLIGIFVILFFLFPSIIWICSGVTVPPWIARMCVFWGALSFPLYVLHYPLVEAMSALARKIDPSGQWFVVWAIATAAMAIAAAWIALRMFDEPVRGWLTRVTRRPPAKPLVETPSQDAST